MELQDLIETYVYNPKEELKNIIIEKARKTSRIVIVNLIDYITKRIAEEVEVKNNYLEIQKLLLEELKREYNKNYVIDDTGRPVELIENNTVKSSKIR